MRYWFVRRSAAWFVPEAEICVLLSPGILKSVARVRRTAEDMSRPLWQKVKIVVVLENRTSPLKVDACL